MVMRLKVHRGQHSQCFSQFSHIYLLIECVALTWSTFSLTLYLIYECWNNLSIWTVEMLLHLHMEDDQAKDVSLHIKSKSALGVICGDKYHSKNPSHRNWLMSNFLCLDKEWHRNHVGVCKRGRGILTRLTIVIIGKEHFMFYNTSSHCG